MIKYFTHTTTKAISCGCPPVAVVLCVDPEIVVEALRSETNGFISATLTQVTKVKSACGYTYQYTVSYEDSQLVDPTLLLADCYIHSLFCDTCLLDYVRNILSSAGTCLGNRYFINNGCWIDYSGEFPYPTILVSYRVEYTVDGEYVGFSAVNAVTGVPISALDFSILSCPAE